jgi:hypothetical protein
MIGVSLEVGRDNAWCPYRYVFGVNESQARMIARVWCLYGDFAGQRAALIETERGRRIVRLVCYGSKTVFEEVQ